MIDELLSKATSEFDEEIRSVSISRIKIICILSIPFFPLFGVLDYFVTPENFRFFLSLRIFSATINLIVLILCFREDAKKYAYPLGALSILPMSFIISTMTRFTGGYISTYYAGLNLMLLAFSLLMPWSLRKTIGVYLAIYLSYVVPIALVDDISNWPLFLNNNFFLVMTLIIAATATFFSHKLRHQEFITRFELKDTNINLGETKNNLEKAYAKLQEMDSIKTQFFANISHELRTPLTLMLAPLETIITSKSQIEAFIKKAQAEMMYQNGLRLLKLINNLLDLAKIDAGKMQLSYSKTDFTKFIKGIIASITPLAEKKEISLSFTCPDPLNEFYFDRDKIEKVLLNLIFNAIKFTPVGGKVEVSCEQSVDQVFVSVTDTGIGIAEENLHKLFNRFSQVDASSSRRFEGTGIGLALSKELIELHKGEISAESKLDSGTTMTFTIPYLENPVFISEEKEEGAQDWTRSLHRAAEYAAAGVVQEAYPTASAVSRGAPPGAPKILVVEDNPDMLHFLVTQLQDDYQVITAQNGVDGIRRAETDLPNLILSDVMMPIKDGYQLCKEVKENALTKHIPIILISAKADLSMKIEGLEYGADDYLTKPFSCEELRARIKSLLNQRALEAQLIHSEKMAAIGLLVAGMAHEINNPINFAKMSLENLSKALTEHDRLIREGKALDSSEVNRLDDKINRAFTIIATGLDRTEAIISDLKAFVRKDDAQFRATDLHAGLDSTLNLMSPELKDQIKVIKEYGDIDLIEAVPGQINQVFMNLLQNAVHAIPDEGEIRIKTWKEEEWVKISVKDTGTGISPEHQKRIFEPFFTTKEVGKGTGLGLSVSYRILQSHSGEIAVFSQPGQGTEFVITLPVRQRLGTAPQNSGAERP